MAEDSGAILVRAVAVAAALTSTSLRERCRELWEDGAAGVLGAGPGLAMKGGGARYQYPQIRPMKRGGGGNKRLTSGRAASHRALD